MLCAASPSKLLIFSLGKSKTGLMTVMWQTGSIHSVSRTAFYRPLLDVMPPVKVRHEDTGRGLQRHKAAVSGSNTSNICSILTQVPVEMQWVLTSSHPHTRLTFQQHLWRCTRQNAHFIVVEYNPLPTKTLWRKLCSSSDISYIQYGINHWIKTIFSSLQLFLHNELMSTFCLKLLEVCRVWKTYISHTIQQALALG